MHRYVHVAFFIINIRTVHKRVHLMKNIYIFFITGECIMDLKVYCTFLCCESVLIVMQEILWEICPIG
jgi:hypothetical protein